MPNITTNRRIVLSGNRRLIQPPISGYSFWFRADGLQAGITNAYGVTDATGNVSQLSDLGGSSITATQATGSKQPAIVSSTIGTKNRKALRFLGTNSQEFDINNASSLLNNKGTFTVYSIAKVNTGGTLSFIWFFSTNSATASRADLRSLVGNTWQTSGRRLDADSIQTVAGNASTSAYKIIASVFDWTNSDGYHYENGTLINSNTSFSTSGSTSATNSAAIKIGCLGGSTNFLTGDIGEIIAYPTAHNSTEVTQMTNWLKSFYGL